MRDEEYHSIQCPADGCDHEDTIRAVAGHVSSTDDHDHSWDRFGYDGAREFVMVEKRRQHDRRDATRRNGAAAPSDSAASNASNTAGGSTASNAASDTASTASDAASATAGESAESSGDDSAPPDATAEPLDLDLDFARDALVLLDFVRRNDVDGADDLDTRQLANLYTLLSDVSRGADDARKEVRDALLDIVQDDSEVISEFGSVRRYTSRRRSLKDDVTVRTELKQAGIDPDEATSLDSKKVRELADERELEESAVFDVEEKSYVKKAGADAERRQSAFDRLDPELRKLLDEK